MNYFWHLIITTGIYTILGASLNILVGYTGILSFTHGLMYGIGAYVLAIFTTKLGIAFIWSVLIGFIVAFLSGFIVMKVLRRLKGDYLILAFFGVQLGGVGVIHNWIPITEGPFGIFNIPKPTIGPFVVSGYFEFMILVWVIVAVVYFISLRLIHSPFGIILKFIREDEIAAQALGKNVIHFKCVVFGLSSAMASMAGALYASYATYIHPHNFGLEISIPVFALIVIGGLGSQIGPLLGAAIVVLMPEFFRVIGFPYSVAAFIQQILYGILLMVLLAFRPEGLLGKYRLG